MKQANGKKNSRPSMLILGEFLSKEDMATQMKCTTKTLDNWSAQGLPRTKIGQRVYYNIPDVIAWMRARATINASRPRR